MIEARWEHGSDLHWIEPSSGGRYPWSAATFYGCGRFALLAAVEHGGWKRVWVPSFFCQEVLVAIPQDRIALVPYADTPLEPATDLSALPMRSGDALFVVNTFGLRARAPRVPDGVDVIEDHTHDLWSDWAQNSTAALAIASLRKLLPVADGGVVWSPRGTAIPTEPPLDDAHARAALDRLQGMLLKAAYLAGGAVEKDAFRTRSLEGERQIATGALSAPLPMTRTMLTGFPVDAWRATRGDNHRAFTTALGQPRGTRVLAPEPGATPYTVNLVFDSHELRESIRARLITSKIYPAVLWAMDHAVVEVPSDTHALSRRILSLHCDARYSAADMARVAAVVRDALAA
jgi:hypothetical protein